MSGLRLSDDVDALTVDLAQASSVPTTIQRAAAWAGRTTGRIARPMRANPWLACFVTAAAFGAALSTWHSLAEGVPSLGAALVIVPVYAALGAAIVVVAYATIGRYLELIRHEGP